MRSLHHNSSVSAHLRLATNSDHGVSMFIVRRAKKGCCFLISDTYDCGVMESQSAARIADFVLDGHQHCHFVFIVCIYYVTVRWSGIYVFAFFNYPKRRK